jgi:hypothetical protein
LGFGFQQASFQILGFFVWRIFFVGKSSGLFLQVSKIGLFSFTSIFVQVLF